MSTTTQVSAGGACLLPGEETAFSIGLQLAMLHLTSFGKIKPNLIALRIADAIPQPLWSMDISAAVQTGSSGLQEIALLTSKLLSEDGCNLSSVGAPQAHWRADGVVLVAEGDAGDETAPSSNASAGDEPIQSTWRALNIEYRSGGRSALMLYRIDRVGDGQLQLTHVARCEGDNTPLLMKPPVLQ